jgi:pectin methylesterase-like acyl-CoA thioesterase
MINNKYALIFKVLFSTVSFIICADTLVTSAVPKKTFDFIIGIDGDFKAATTAAMQNSSSGKRFYLFFPKGEYNIGKLTGDANQMTSFTASNVSFIGENADSTIIYNQSTNEGISITSTLYFNKANNLYLQDLSILNKANYRNGSDLSKTGRYVAVKEQGDKLIYKNVKLLSTQDTYYTVGNRTYWEDGEIHGTVDFICGYGDLFFNKCLLYLEKNSGCITAPGTKSSWGYVFMNCTIDGTGGNYLLGRPWNDSPRCVYISTIMKKLPTAAAWGDPMNVVPAFFAEYNSKTVTGSTVDLSGRRTSYSLNGTTVKLNPVLSASQAAQYTIPNVLKGNDNWQPDNLTKQVSAPVLRKDGKVLTWNDNDSALCWVVFKNRKFFKCVTTNSLEITPDATVKYFVRAANSMGGLGPGSNIVDGVTTSVNKELKPFHSANQFLFDSARKIIYIQNKAPSTYKIKIYSLSGKLLYSKSFQGNSTELHFEISLKNLNQGVYIYKIEYAGCIKSGEMRLL